MEKTDIQSALEAAQELTVALYTALREDMNLSRDYQLIMALQRPCFALISALAAAEATNLMKYRERQWEVAVGRVAVILALLETARKAQALEEETHSILLQKILRVQVALN